ncbi:MAG: hypothetical protein AVDCRST_MAG12-1562, partial [uncultured Rubrobacteraceae bacterium]
PDAADDARAARGAPATQRDPGPL